MPWFKVDDALYSHPKWLATPSPARALWVTAGSWCSSQLTDGLVPRHVLPILGGRSKDAADLVKAGLWLAVDEGWQFHGWLELQPSAEQVEAERSAARERQRRARDKARESRRDIGRTSPESHGPPDPTRPDPTRPDPTSQVTSSAAATTSPDAKRRLLEHAATIIGDRAAQRPGTRDPAATARAVARGITQDRCHDAFQAIAATPTITAEELAQHLEPVEQPTMRPTLPPTHTDERIADLNPASVARIPDEDRTNGLASVAALRQQLHPTPDDAA